MDGRGRMGETISPHMEKSRREDVKNVKPPFTYLLLYQNMHPNIGEREDLLNQICIG